MDMIFDWQGMRWLLVRRACVSENALYALWRCTIHGQDPATVFPMIEYFNGAVYIPADLNRDYEEEIRLIRSADALPRREIQWVALRSGRPAHTMNGLPL
jgi:hypothetical protein